MKIRLFVIGVVILGICFLWAIGYQHPELMKFGRW